MKEKNKYDQMPSILCNWLQQILPLVKKVTNEIVSKETEILNLQCSIVKLSDLEPHVCHAYVSSRTLRYNISCAFPSMAAWLDMPSTYHLAVPLCANRFSDDLVNRHVMTVRHLTWPGTKLSHAQADPMPMHQRGLLGSTAKTASHLYAHTCTNAHSPPPSAASPSPSSGNDPEPMCQGDLLGSHTHAPTND